MTADRRGRRNRQTRKPLFRGWWIVLIASLAMFVDSGVGGYAFAALIRPMSVGLQTSVTSIVLGSTIASVTSAAISFVAGPLIDRYGARFSLTGGALVLSGLLIGISQVTDLWQFYLLFGVGIGFTRPLVGQVSPVASVGNWFVRRRSEAFAVMSLGASAAGVLLTPLTGLVIAGYGWRAAWVVFGLMPLVLVAPPAYFFIRRRPEDVGLLADGDVAKPVPTRSVGDPDPVWTRAMVVRTSAFWLLLISQVFMNAPASGLFLHIVAFAEDYGFEPTLATTVLSVYAFGALSGRAIWSYLTNRFGIRGALIGQAFGWGAGIAGLSVLAIFGLPAPVLYAASFVLGCIGGGTIQLRSQAWADYFGRNVLGAITGYSAVAQTITSAAGPVFLGAVRDSTGSYLAGFWVFVVCCVVAGIILLYAKPPASRRGP